ncbi:hypothetical protein [Pediococcus stilesii]|nr:hypothetical protein [Pediococcus stilesii]
MIVAGASSLAIFSNKEDVENIKELLYENIKISEKAEPVSLIHEIIK